MKHPAWLLLLLLLTTPLAPSSAPGGAANSNPMHLRPVTIKPEISSKFSTDERLTLLEAFEQQQKDYNKEMDHHMTEHMDDLLRSQGEQDEKIRTLQSQEDVVYKVGEGIAWLLSILITVYFIYNGRKYREAQTRHEFIQKALEDLDGKCVSIDKSILLLSTQMDYIKKQEEIDHGRGSTPHIP